MRRNTVRAVARAAVAAAVAALLVPLGVAGPAAATATATPAVTGGVAYVAGNGVGDGGLATDARFHPRALDRAPDGDLLVVESTRLRRVDGATGIVTTIAGTGVRGATGDGGPATAATFDGMGDVAAAPDGTFYVVMWDRVRRIAPDGVVTTFLELRGVEDVELSPSGAIYVATRSRVWRHSGAGLTPVAGGGTSTAASVTDARTARLHGIDDLEFTKAGHLLVVETDMFRVRRVAGGAPGAAMTTIADFSLTITGEPHAVAVRADDTAVIGTRDVVYTVANAGGTPGPRTLVDQGSSPCGSPSTVAADGVPLASCYRPYPPSIVRLPGNGTKTVVAGAQYAKDGMPNEDAWFDDVADIAAAPDGTVYVADAGRVRALGADGVLHTLAGTTAYGPSSGDGGPATAAAFERLRRIAPAPDGTLVVADGPRLRRVVPGGAVTLLAGGETPFAEGAPAAGTALAGNVTGVAVAGDGTVYATAACVTYRIATDGTVTTVPGPPCDPTVTVARGDVAVDAQGRPVVRVREQSHTALYVTDDDGTVRQLDRDALHRGLAVTPSGSIETPHASLRPDGSRMEQRYPHPRYGDLGWEDITAEASGTLLALSALREIYRLTPANQVLPPPVTGLTVTPGPGSLTLEWDAAASDERTAIVARITSGTTAPATLPLGMSGQTLPAGSTTVTLRSADLTQDYPGLREEPYSVSVFAVGPGGEAAPATATATPLPDTTPPAPGSGLVLSVADGMLNAAWTRPPDADLFSPVPRLAPAAVASPAEGTPSPSYGPEYASWPIAGLAEGTYTVTVFQADMLGNLSEPLTGSVFVDKTPPPAVTGLTVVPSGGGYRIRATWNAASPDAAKVRARLLTGYEFPATPEQGLAPVASTATSAEWPVTYFGAEHRVAVFTTDVAGNSARATYFFVPRRPAVLQIATPAAVAYGTRAEVRGYLGSPAGSPHQSQRIELWGRYGTAPYRFVTAAQTDYRGRVTLSHTPTANVQYQLRHPRSTVAAVSSAVRTVGVVPEVLANQSARRVSPGAAVTFYGGLDPRHLGAPLTLQRYAAGAWRDVLTASIAADGVARFRVRAPSAAGTHAYRVLFRGDADHRSAASPSMYLTVG